MKSNVVITSDGTPSGTQLEVGGIPLHGIKRLLISMDGTKASGLCELDIHAAPVNYFGGAAFMVTHPVDGSRKQVQSITFTDGTTWEATPCNA